MAIPVLALAAAITAASIAPASGDDGAGDPTTTVEQSFSATGAEQSVWFDIGVRAVDVIAIGGSGADISGRPGGFGAKVSARVPVGPERKFFVLVGGDGDQEQGGFNGGGPGSKPSWTSVRGGGGGGATDLRTVGSSSVDSVASRVLVAGGGGGAGGASARGGRLGGVGGQAGQAGARGDNATNNNTVGSGGFGGGRGGSDSGGAGGAGGFVYPNGANDGSPGGEGSLGVGGYGGDGASNTGTGMGAGGGGGYYGGGGGGGGMFDFFEQEYFSGGGGGGGGSSLVPDEAGTISLAAIEDEPSVEISYTVPGTTILSGPDSAINVRRAEFSFTASEPGSTFECRLDEAGDFAPCEGQTAFDDLSEGDHILEVRAINEMGNFDGSPAEWAFKVDLSPPIVTIAAGPSGKVTGHRPEFAFSSSEADVTFQCRFDEEPFRACSGSTSDRPIVDLSVGAHTFSVRATDRAGNVGPEATHDFEVEAGKPNPRPARLQLKRPKLKRAKGIALLPAKVSGPGKVVLLKSKMVRATKRKAGKATTVRLKVAARGKALKKLRTKGKLKLKVRVRFTPKNGAPVTKSKRLTLRKKVRRR